MSAVLSLLGKVPGIVWTVGVLGAAFLYNLYRNQEALLFYPQPPGLQWRRTSDNPSPLDSPARPPWNLAFEDLEVKTSDGVRLHGWFVRAPASVDYTTAPTVLFFHGNAGNIGFRLENIAMLVRSLPANVMIVDYRGYGNSEEVSPTEPGVLLDGLAMADALLARADVDRRKVFYFGRSLGGAVAIATAANARFADSVAGLILENTFTSIGASVPACGCVFYCGHACELSSICRLHLPAALVLLDESSFPSAYYSLLPPALHLLFTFLQSS